MPSISRKRCRCSSPQVNHSNNPRRITSMRTLLFTFVIAAIWATPLCSSFQLSHHHPSRRQTSLPFIATTSDATVQEQDQKISKVHRYFRINKKDRKASKSYSGVSNRDNRFCSPPCLSSPSITSCASAAAAGYPVSDSVGSVGWGNWESYDTSRIFRGSDGTGVKHGRLSNVYAPPSPTSPYPTLKQQQLEQHVGRTVTIQDPKLAEVQRRKDEWAKRYTSLEGLRETFGSNQNKLWGDLDAATARRLYKTLLPTALCELVLDLGVTAEELAPLAYQARKAAKLYARERCRVPARVAATVYDGVRQWKRYGRFQPSGMSYEQVWDKYYNQSRAACTSEEEIVSKTCQTILEKSCKTNEMIDRWFLQSPSRSHSSKGNDSDAMAAHKKDLERRRRGNMLMREIAHTLEMDFRKLLDPFSPEEDEDDEEATDGDVLHGRKRQHARTPRPHLTQQQYHALKLFALALRESKFEMPPKMGTQ